MRLFRRTMELPSADEAPPGRPNPIPTPDVHFINGNRIKPPFPTRIPLEPAFLSLVTMLASGSAFAHSEQEVTFPEDGAVLRGPPDVVSMKFDQPMRITMVRLTSETTGGAIELDRTDDMLPVSDFRATPPDLPNGLYTVEWRGLAPDGHAMKCRFSFRVAQ